METDVGVAASCGQESSLNLTPSEVRSMHDAAVGVATLTGQVQGAVCTHTKKSRRAKSSRSAAGSSTPNHSGKQDCAGKNAGSSSDSGLPPPAARKFAACNPAALNFLLPSPWLRVKSAPIFTSSSTRAGPSRHTASTALVVGTNKMDQHMSNTRSAAGQVDGMHAKNISCMGAVRKGKGIMEQAAYGAHAAGWSRAGDKLHCMSWQRKAQLKMSSC